jgi:hypothetical protein
MRRLRNLTIALVLLALALAFVAPSASANISNRRWDRSTIYFQNMTPNATYNPVGNDMVAYYAGLGANMSLVQHVCVVNVPCIRVEFSDFGATTWEGLTTEAWTGCLTVNKFCRFGATNVCSNGCAWTRIQLNTHWLNGLNAHDRQHDARHEMGHAFSLQHAGGTTVMQANGYAYNLLLNGEITEIRNSMVGVPR